VAEVLPLLYLHGPSSSDFGPALEQFLGTGQGLSAATVTRLTQDWRREVAQSGREDHQRPRRAARFLRLPR
jgi:putative transposase